MEGDKLLCYVSYRIEDGELERNLRQQEVLRLLFQRVVQGGNLAMLPEWLDAYLGRVETDFSMQDFLEAVPLALRLGDRNRIGFFRFSPGDLNPWQIPGELPVSVFIPDRPGLQAVLQDAIDFVLQAEPPSDQVLTLEFELTTSPTATITPTPTMTGTPTATPTRTLTPVRLPTNTRTPTITRTPTHTMTVTLPPQPDRIAFSADRNGDGYLDILTMYQDGSHITPLVQLSQDALVWDWKPDGSQLVYERGNQLYILSASGQTELPLTGLPAGTNTQAAWSPVGDWIVFRNENVQSDLYIIHPDGTGLRQLLDDTANDAEPAWSPDGTQVVFISDRDGNPEIYVMDVADFVAPTPTPVPFLTITRLTNTLDAEASPRYSPDGTLLVYARFSGGQWDILFGSPDNLSAPNPLTNDPQVDGMPAWSADGSSIVFVRDGEIYRMDADGTDRSLINNGFSAEQNPRWSP
jgi:dipeptidyl aminopeptidase/acylaminoacyl peptidase